MTAAELVGSLERVRARGSNKWSAKCPAHSPDKSPSLTIAEGEKCLLVKCWAGCSLNEITGALGIKVSDLFFDALSTDPHQRREAMRQRAQVKAAREAAHVAEGRRLDTLRQAEQLIQSARGISIEGWSRHLTTDLISCKGGALMAVAFGTKFESSSSSPGASGPFSFVSNAGTIPGSVGANSNRGLIAAVSFNRNAAALGTVTCTWAGNSMNQVAQTDLPGGLNGSVYLFELHTDALITTGAQTLLVDWTTAVNPTVYLGAISFYNVDQTTGVQNTGSNTGTDAAPTCSITTANGNAAVAVHDNNNASSTAMNAGTSDWIDTAFSTNGAAAHVLSSGSSATISWTLGSSVEWCIAKLDVIAASGGGGPTPAQLVPAFTRSSQSYGVQYV